MSVLGKATRALEHLARAGEPVRLSALAAELELPKSSAHRLLAELVECGIARRSEDGRYALGARLLYWGAAAGDSFDLRVHAEPAMRKLRDAEDESVHLYIREDIHRVCIAAVESRRELRPFVALGRQLPLGQGSGGRILLACAPGPVAARVREQAAALGHPLPDDAELARIREERWALSHGEREDGVAAVAVGIEGRGRRIVGALTVSGSSARLTRERLTGLRGSLEACAGAVGARLV